MITKNRTILKKSRCCFTYFPNLNNASLIKEHGYDDIKQNKLQSYLVDIKVFDDSVKTCVQSIKKINNLQTISKIVLMHFEKIFKH